MASSNNSLSSLNVVGYTHTPPNNHLSSLSHVTLITVTVLAVAVTVSLAFYFLLRYRSRFLRRSSPSIAEVFSSANRISPETASSSVADSLPTFAFSSVTRHGGGGSGDGDCAVCLSKFEQHDLLRLLPLCCHAFHAECIDTWLRSNLTCPLCRSAVVGSESDLAKVFRSYAHRRSVSGEKDDGDPAEPLPSLAGEVERGGSSNNDSNSWLKDYVDRLSNTMSFRSSGRFFTGNSRRSDVVAGGDYDVEANRFGDEIGEVFRWLSGV
uniref:RING-type E3 ubiquitin transferase n=1 Tax=Cajanus cajan TaxID=3821 RepID=A0A151RAD8_CAJCA|nr:RING-H2 finger protein ATL3J [Cajanus cajan]